MKSHAWFPIHRYVSNWKDTATSAYSEKNVGEYGKKSYKNKTFFFKMITDLLTNPNKPGQV